MYYSATLVNPIVDSVTFSLFALTSDFTNSDNQKQEPKNSDCETSWLVYPIVISRQVSLASQRVSTPFSPPLSTAALNSALSLHKPRHPNPRRGANARPYSCRPPSREGSGRRSSSRFPSTPSPSTQSRPPPTGLFTLRWIHQ